MASRSHACITLGLYQANLTRTQVQKKGRYGSRDGAPNGAFKLKSLKFDGYLLNLLRAGNSLPLFQPSTTMEYFLPRDLIIFWSRIVGWSTIESDFTRITSINRRILTRNTCYNHAIIIFANRHIYCILEFYPIITRFLVLQLGIGAIADINMAKLFSYTRQNNNRLCKMDTNLPTLCSLSSWTPSLPSESQVPLPMYTESKYPNSYLQQ